LTPQVSLRNPRLRDPRVRGRENTDSCKLPGSGPDPESTDSGSVSTPKSSISGGSGTPRTRLLAPQIPLFDPQNRRFRGSKSRNLGVRSPPESPFFFLGPGYPPTLPLERARKVPVLDEGGGYPGNRKKSARNLSDLGPNPGPRSFNPDTFLVTYSSEDVSKSRPLSVLESLARDSNVAKKFFCRRFLLR